MEKDGDMSMILNKLRDENQRCEQLMLSVKSQEVEISTLLKCVDSLRTQLVEK